MDIRCHLVTSFYVLTMSARMRVWSSAEVGTLAGKMSFFFFQAEDGIRDIGVTGGSDVCSSDLLVLAANWALMPHQRIWKPFMLAASYAFYAAAGWKFCLLLAAITIGNQVAARWIARTEDQRARKRILVAAVALDLGVLDVFKYYGFFATQINDVLEWFGLGLSAPLVALAIPLGVSFFTFRAISYTVDVYRGTIEPASLIDVALYLTFFPHVVAGPIVRAKEFLPQLEIGRA